MGRSLLETLATGSTLLPADYWEQGEHRPDSVKEEQRQWLNSLETARIYNNPGARPIRVVRVAWAIIRIGNQFLLSHREDRKRPGEKLATVPDACVNGYALADETRMIDLPASNACPLRIGKTGKERSIEPGLTEPECHLLQLLGWHALSFLIETKPGVQCLGGGWIRLDIDDIAIGRSILAKCMPHDLPLLDIREQHIRLNISPKFLFVGAEAFIYLIEEEDSASGTLTLIRQAVDTPWALLPESRGHRRVKANPTPHNTAAT